MLEFMLSLVHSSGPEPESGPVARIAADERFVAMLAAHNAAVLVAARVHRVRSDLAFNTINGSAILLEGSDRPNIGYLFPSRAQLVVPFKQDSPVADANRQQKTCSNLRRPCDSL